MILVGYKIQMNSLFSKIRDNVFALYFFSDTYIYSTSPTKVTIIIGNTKSGELLSVFIWPKIPVNTLIRSMCVAIL